MDVVESLRIGWRNLIDHRLRSTLTTLGVVIGVGAVIAFVTLGASVREEIVGQIGADAQRVLVFASPPGQPGAPGLRDELVFTERDLHALRDVAGVRAVIPQGNVRLTNLAYGERTLRPAAVFATTAQHFEFEDFRAGGAFEDGASEVVLNASAADMTEEPLQIGDALRVQTGDGEPRESTVVGILARGGGGILGNFQEPPLLYLPVDPFYDRTVTSPSSGEAVAAFSNVEVAATDVSSVEEVEERVLAYLRTESDAAELLPFGYEFRSVTSEEIIDTVRDVIGTLTGFITGIALISLVVGAIGIANIMLVSVTERTREIGIMKAVGGRRRAILQLFLVEAAILGIVGAMLGTGVGVGAAFVAARMLELSLVFPFVWFGVAIAVGVLVGLVSGMYPAWRAARLDPIGALRYE